MVLQKLDLVDDHITTTTGVLQDASVDGTTPGSGRVQQREKIVLAFDVGDEENAGNWPKASPPHFRQSVYTGIR